MHKENKFLASCNAEAQGVPRLKMIRKEKVEERDKWLPKLSPKVCHFKCRDKYPHDFSLDFHLY